MKILIINSSYFPNIIGGAERSVQFLAESLVKKNIKVVILNLSNENKIKNINGVKVYYIKSKISFAPFQGKNKPKTQIIFSKLIDFYNPLYRKKILKIIKEENPDIIHTNNVGGFSINVWKVIKSLKLPIVHTIRDHYLLCVRATMFKNGKICKNQCISCKAYTFPRRVLSCNIDAVIGVSKNILHEHLRFGYFKNSKIKTYVYNPIRKKIKSPKSFSKKDIFFGFVGQINRGKGIEFLLKEFLKIKNSNVNLYIFGKGSISFEKYLKEKYMKGNIKFLGFKPVNEIYSEIDVLIVPTLYNEPFPRVILEAYAYGIPVIGSNRGGIPESIINNKTGFIFEPDKENDLKEKMKIFIENPNLISDFSNNCLKFVERFDEDKIVNQYIDVYKTLVEKKERDYEL